jgi:hypothetical protein
VGNQPTIEIEGDGSLVLIREKIEVTAQSLGEVPIEQEINFDEMLISLLNPESPGTLSIRQWGVILDSAELPPLESQAAGRVDGTRNGVLELIDRLRNSESYSEHKIHWLVVLVERYMRQNQDFPIPNLDGVTSILTNNGGGLIESQAMECLRTLRYLQQNDYRGPTTDLFEQESPIQPMLISLHVTGQYRLFQSGMANQSVIQNLATLLDHSIDSGDERGSTERWLSVMLKLCRHMSGTAQNHPGPASPVPRLLLGFDAGLNDWLEQ